MEEAYQHNLTFHIGQNASETTGDAMLLLGKHVG